MKLIIKKKKIIVFLGYVLALNGLLTYAVNFIGAYSHEYMVLMHINLHGEAHIELGLLIISIVFSVVGLYHYVKMEGKTRNAA